MAVSTGYVGSAAITWTASATATVAGQSIGTASAQRIVLVAVGLEGDVDFNSCTIGGITATVGPQVRNTGGTPDDVCRFFYAPVPTGTTANIVVTASASISLSGRISVWAVTGAAGIHTDSNTNTGSGTTLTLTGVTINPGGAGFWCFCNATDTTAVTWTNATLRDDTDAGTFRHSVADSTTAGTATITADGATAQQAIVGIAFDDVIPVSQWLRIPRTEILPLAHTRSSLAAYACGLIAALAPPPTPAAAQESFADSGSVSLTRTLHYQSKVYAPYEPPAVEIIGPDKWLIKWDKPPRYLLPLASGAPFVPKEAVLENTTNTVWPLTFGQIARPIPRVAFQGYHLFTPKEATLENTTNTVWPLTQGVKASPISRVAPQGLFTLGYPYLAAENTQTIDKWLVPLSRAVPIPRAFPQGISVSGYPYPSIENTQTIIEWFRPLSQSVKIPRAAPQGQWTFGYPYEGVDNTRAEWDWTIQWPDRSPRFWWLGRPYSPFVPKEATRENTTNTLWPLTFGEKARPTPQTAPLGIWTFGFPYEVEDNSRTEWDWSLKWPDRMPRVWWKGRPYQPFVPKAAVLENTVTPDKWMQRFYAPTPPRPVTHTTITFAYTEPFVDNTGTLPTWYNQWKLAPKYKPQKELATPFIPKESPVANTLGHISWMMAFPVQVPARMVWHTTTSYGRPEVEVTFEFTVRRVFSDVYYY